MGRILQTLLCEQVNCKPASAGFCENLLIKSSTTAQSDFVRSVILRRFDSGTYFRQWVALKAVACESIPGIWGYWTIWAIFSLTEREETLTCAPERGQTHAERHSAGL